MTAVSDIVERLRTAIQHDESERAMLFEEAAAEIERLRANASDMACALDYMRTDKSGAKFHTIETRHNSILHIDDLIKRARTLQGGFRCRVK